MCEARKSINKIDSVTQENMWIRSVLVGQGSRFDPADESTPRGHPSPGPQICDLCEANFFLDVSRLRTLPVPAHVHIRPHRPRQPDYTHAPAFHCIETVHHPQPTCCNRLRITCTKRRASPRCFALARATASRPPYLRGAARHRSNPFSVRAPVLAPPCIRQRPFAIAAPWQG